MSLALLSTYVSDIIPKRLITYQSRKRRCLQRPLFCNTHNRSMLDIAICVMWQVPYKNSLHTGNINIRPLSQWEGFCFKFHSSKLIYKLAYVMVYHTDVLSFRICFTSSISGSPLNIFMLAGCRISPLIKASHVFCCQRLSCDQWTNYIYWF